MYVAYVVPIITIPNVGLFIIAVDATRMLDGLIALAPHLTGPTILWLIGNPEGKPSVNLGLLQGLHLVLLS